MFAEFFLQSSFSTTAVAWGGLVVVFGYSMFLAWVKTEINDFYTDFYDLLQHALPSGGGGYDDGSGEQPPRPAEYRQQVWEQLLRFARIVAPLVISSPAAKWTRSAWAFSWRTALMKSYLKSWDISNLPIEGASQRLHEDTQRFCNALQGCIATMLDAAFTLCVFTPILFDLSQQVAPPVAAGPLRGVWLWLLAVVAAIVGLGGAMVFGRKLVELEAPPRAPPASHHHHALTTSSSASTAARFAGKQPKGGSGVPQGAPRARAFARDARVVTRAA